MGVRITADDNHAVIWDSVSDWAFGPVFYPDENGNSPRDMATDFLDWLEEDARTYSPSVLEDLYSEWYHLQRYT